MGLMQRRKGRKAESDFKRVLQDRDWQVDDLAAGIKDADLVATDPQGCRWCIEVKAHKLLKLREFVTQAKEQAGKKKLPWLLACQLPLYPDTWLIIAKGKRPVVWAGKLDVG